MEHLSSELPTLTVEELQVLAATDPSLLNYLPEHLADMMGNGMDTNCDDNVTTDANLGSKTMTVKLKKEK